MKSSFTAGKRPTRSLYLLLSTLVLARMERICGPEGVDGNGVALKPVMKRRNRFPHYPSERFVRVKKSAVDSGRAEAPLPRF